MNPYPHLRCISAASWFVPCPDGYYFEQQNIIDGMVRYAERERAVILVERDGLPALLLYVRDGNVQA